MGRRWQQGPTDAQAGPYQFYTTARRCPACGELLLSQEPVSFGPTAKIIHVLGVSCYCMGCNGRFRVTARPWMRFLPWILGALCVVASFGAMVVVNMIFVERRILRMFFVLIGMACVFFLLRLIPVSRRLWWQMVKIKKILTYQDGF